MNKRGMELSVNVLVVVLLSIVLLSGGIYLLNSFIKDTLKTQAELDSMTTEQLERLLVDEGKQVALPFFSAELKGGESHIFGLGILNIDESKYGEKFWISIELSKYLNEIGQPPVDLNFDDTKADAEEWLLYYQEILTVKENEHVEEAILVEVPGDAKKGTYIFDVKVWHSPPAGNEDQYDFTKQLYIVVI